MKTPVQVFNKQFSARLNLVFLALELSWKYLLLGAARLGCRGRLRKLRKLRRLRRLQGLRKPET